MPVLNSVADVLTRKFPKIVPANAHLAADYALAGSFLAAGTWFWRRNRRASLAAFVCGGSGLGLALLTSFPGREKRAIGFPLHGKLEIGLAALIATMPEFLRFENDREKSYFLTSAAVLTVLSNLTSFYPPRTIRKRISSAG